MASPSSLSVNSWELCALKYEFPARLSASPDGQEAATAAAAAVAWRQLPDPIIYPGVYSASGYDIMSLLIRVTSRPDPKIEIGAVDCSAAFVVCDLSLNDSPIVYVSDPFCKLTGYSKHEVVGRNCRFLQKPCRGRTPPPAKPAKDDKATVQRVANAVRDRQEIQVAVSNFKKCGERFTNLLSIVPLQRDSSGHQYAIGFQAQID